MDKTFLILLGAKTTKIEYCKLDLKLKKKKSKKKFAFSICFFFQHAQTERVHRFLFFTLAPILLYRRYVHTQDGKMHAQDDHNFFSARSSPKNTYVQL